MSAFKAGLAYFATVFAVGFILGAVRVFALEPLLGKLASVLIELPVILAVSWFICGRIIDAFHVPKSISARFFMGLLAFALLMTAELMLARYGFDRTPPEQLREMTTASGAVGLVGQIIYGMIPLMQVHARR
ncbi:hypothetical protein PUV54_08115 [Hyphococcus flavus]|uniref:Uncharacterized protein n=1 Tax=Hyphococcus flavus TaxID=1866326 RepID=A0AAF0CCC6_9PROT|nr:hypothetical protein [Hyphococcus flavus]WDI33160.1 hypothetical protein PUV54_08115 [Hyphococcus flavus]